MALYRDRDWLEQRYLRDGFSTRKIAEICGVGATTIKRWVKKYDLISKRTQLIIESVKNLTSENKAYIAGLCDGEGYVGVEIDHYRHDPSIFWARPCIKIGLSAKDKQVLFWLKSKMPFGNISNAGSHPNYKSLSFDIRSRDGCLAFIQAILPYSKIPSMVEKLTLQKELIQLKPNYKRISKEQKVKMVQIIRQLRALAKKKGPKWKRLNPSAVALWARSA